MAGLFQDIRYAVRQMRNKPGFALTAVITLTLGIGANVAIFSIVNGIILRPLPVPQPRQITVLAAQQQGSSMGIFSLSYPELVDFRKQADTYSDLFAYAVDLEGMSADNRADHFLASFVTGNYFSALGLKPALGRLFLPGEGEKSGSEALAVIGYSYWQRRFGGNSNVIGKQVLLNGKPATIIGVTPKGFRGTAFALDLDGYLPLSMAAASDPDLWTSRTDRRWNTLGRLKPGVSLAQAQSSVEPDCRPAGAAVSCNRQGHYREHHSRAVVPPNPAARQCRCHRRRIVSVSCRADLAARRDQRSQHLARARHGPRRRDGNT